MKDITYAQSEAYNKGYADALKWHDATKELPEDGEWVLVSGTELEIKMVEPYIGFCVQGFWWSKGGDTLKVDYWMPLPELPEKEESK